MADTRDSLPSGICHTDFKKFWEDKYAYRPPRPCRRCGKVVEVGLKPHKCRKSKAAKSSGNYQEKFFCKSGCCNGRRCEHAWNTSKARKFRKSW